MTQPSRAYKQAYYRKHKARLTKLSEASRLQRQYGLTPEDVEVATLKQNGRCLICGRRPAKLHIDHCHQTKRFRGLLCGACNRMLGLARESVVTLQSAVAYLETHE